MISFTTDHGALRDQTAVTNFERELSGKAPRHTAYEQWAGNLSGSDTGFGMEGYYRLRRLNELEVWFNDS